MDEETISHILNTDIELDDIDICNIDSLNYNQAIKIHYLVLKKIDPLILKKIRNKNYWYIYDNCKNDDKIPIINPKTKKPYKDKNGKILYYKQNASALKMHKRRLLLIAAYINNLYDTEMNWEYLKIITPKIKKSKSKLQPNKNFYNEQ